MKLVAFVVAALALPLSAANSQARRTLPIVQTVRTAPTPVITPAQARGANYGHWKTDDAGDFTEAFTGNESGSIFGILCGTSCIFYVDFQIGCDEGDDYPAMVNSAQGAFQVSLKCHHFNDRYVLTTNATAGYFDILKGGGEVGFAIPLQSGRFNVSRFSTVGGYNAVSAAVAAAAKKSQESQEGLRDFTI